MPPQKRLLLTAPTPRVEVGESSAATARQPGSTMGRRVDHSFVDTVDTKIRDTERRTMAAIEVVNLRVSYQADVRKRESLRFYSRHQEAQEDRAAVRAEIEILRRERLAYKQESIETLPRAPKRATRSNIAPETTNTTSVTNAQLQAMINQGVTVALAARDANTNGIDNHNSGTCARRNKRATCETVGNDITYAMTWTGLKKKITDKYCPRTEIKKLEVEIMFPEESDKIEKYVGGLPDMIHGSVVASKPKTMQEATEMVIEVMDKRIRTFADWTVEKKQYGGSKPLCSKFNYHHDGPCAPKCHKFNKVSHFARDCRSMANANNANNQKGTRLGQKSTCYECGVQGHFKRECPKLKNNNNRSNQVGGGNAPAKVYAVGHAGTNPDSNVVKGIFLRNNRYASILFDTSADRSFVSTAFSSQIDITPTALDHYYDVELADRRIIGLNTILRGCTL
ncbi:reverse transcriptase domain-containing protein, partial [Tanacetum coccineum]